MSEYAPVPKKIKISSSAFDPIKQEEERKQRIKLTEERRKRFLLEKPQHSQLLSVLPIPQELSEIIASYDKRCSLECANVGLYRTWPNGWPKDCTCLNYILRNIFDALVNFEVTFQLTTDKQITLNPQFFSFHFTFMYDENMFVQFIFSYRPLLFKGFIFVEKLNQSPDIWFRRPQMIFKKQYNFGQSSIPNILAEIYQNIKPAYFPKFNLITEIKFKISDLYFLAEELTKHNITINKETMNRSIFDFKNSVFNYIFENGVILINTATAHQTLNMRVDIDQLKQNSLNYTRTGDEIKITPRFKNISSSTNESNEVSFATTSVIVPPTKGGGSFIKIKKLNIKL